MPQVVCSHCGEELMGSVNRCWRCGRTFVAEHNPENLPPIRRRPIPLELVNKSFEELAQAAAAPRAASRASANEIVDAPAVAIAAEILDESPAGALPSPSPFPASHPAPFYAPAPTPSYPTNAGAMGGAVASVVLGLMALAAIRLIAPGALLISILGVGMGIWGLYSDRRAIAVIGLLLCCIALSAAGFLAAVDLYELIHGYSPFEADLPVNDPGGF